MEAAERRIIEEKKKRIEEEKKRLAEEQKTKEKVNKKKSAFDYFFPHVITSSRPNGLQR
jgi:hypothetical protein